MTPVISIVGKSDSGKTCFLEEIIPRLVSKGIKVATVKHDVHGFSIDRPGKDSWRHKESGASMVIISSPQKIALIRDVEEEYTIDELQNAFGEGFDIILTEGYKKGDKAKIEIFRPGKHQEKLCSPFEDKILGTVINQENKEGRPSFLQEELDSIVEKIIDYIKEGREK